MEKPNFDRREAGLVHAIEDWKKYCSTQAHTDEDVESQTTDDEYSSMTENPCWGMF